MDLVGAALRNPINRAILQRLSLLGAPQAWLVAGCVYQAVWNELAGRPPHSDIKDYDVFYFDDTDLSWEAEDAVIQRGRVLFADLDGLIEIRNQARVHLWYPQRFGAAYPALASTEDGIGRFLVRCTCVGLMPQGDGSLGLYAPYGLDELERGILKPNANAPSLHRFREKAESYRARWPWLKIEDD
jgi:uncharacterized protein